MLRHIDQYDRCAVQAEDNRQHDELSRVSALWYLTNRMGSNHSTADNLNRD